MPAYILARIDVQDGDAYQEYMKHSPRIINKFGGRFLIRGGETVHLEGSEETHRIVLIEFPSMDQAKAFYASDEYSLARKLREGAGSANITAVDGYSMEQWEEIVLESSAFELP